MVDLKETISNENPRGKPIRDFIPIYDEAADVTPPEKYNAAQKCTSKLIDDTRKLFTKTELKETGFCAKCGKEWGSLNTKGNDHVFVSCFAAPDVELAMKEKDKEIQRLMKEKKTFIEANRGLAKGYNDCEKKLDTLIERDAKLVDISDALQANFDAFELEQGADEAFARNLKKLRKLLGRQSENEKYLASFGVGLLRGNERGEKTK